MSRTWIRAPPLAARLVPWTTWNAGTSNVPGLSASAKKSKAHVTSW